MLICSNKAKAPKSFISCDIFKTCIRSKRSHCHLQTQRINRKPYNYYQFQNYIHKNAKKYFSLSLPGIKNFLNDLKQTETISYPEQEIEVKVTINISTSFLTNLLIVVFILCRIRCYMNLIFPFHTTSCICFPWFIFHQVPFYNFVLLDNF